VKQIIDMSPDQYGNMSQKARQHVIDHFSVESMVTGYEEVYAKILGV
jgi:hypothetical protein